MTITFEIEDSASPALRELIEQNIPEARQHMVNQLAADVLDHTAQENPVDSGRSRAGWLAAAEQLPGSQVSGAGATGEGTLRLNHDQTTTSVSAINQVPYVTYLEYGTSKMAPFAMLRRTLSRIRGQLGNRFRIEKK